MFKHNVLFLLLFFQFGILASQNNINYTITSDEVSLFGESQQINSTIKKKGDLLIWIQEKNGKIKEINFRIQKTKGAWDSINSEGSVTYSLKNKDYNGYKVLFNLKSIPDGTVAYFFIRRNGNNKKRKEDLYTFTISEIIYQP